MIISGKYSDLLKIGKDLSLLLGEEQSQKSPVRIIP